ncbi:MAG: phosphoribosyltransferase family protein [Desulfosalsimonadaceae bacterium]
MNDYLQELTTAKAPELIPVLSEEAIQRKVARLARRISVDYQTQSLLLIGVLKGAFVFLSDLIRRLTIPVEIDFIQLSSYGRSNISCGEVSFQSSISADLQGKSLLIVEDIIDTGLTMTHLVKHLKQCSPESIGVCTLIDKYERREVAFEADYVCHGVKRAQRVERTRNRSPGNLH